MPFTIFLYLLLIDATWYFDLVLPIILDVGKQFKDVSLTNVIASMFSFLYSKYSSCRCWCKAVDFLLGGFWPLLFIMCLLWLRHTSRAENQQVLSPLFEKNELLLSTCSAFSKVLCPQILRSYMHIVGKY